MYLVWIGEILLIAYGFFQGFFPPPLNIVAGLFLGYHVVDLLLAVGALLGWAAVKTIRSRKRD